jgi:hypothetical protein
MGETSPEDTAASSFSREAFRLSRRFDGVWCDEWSWFLLRRRLEMNKSLDAGMFSDQEFKSRPDLLLCMRTYASIRVIHVYRLRAPRTSRPKPAS